MPSGPSDRTRRLDAALAALVALGVFVALRFPGVGGLVNHGDSAKFQFLGVNGGIGHAPGNPGYLQALRAVQALPFGGDPASRANLLSAVCGALTIGLVTSATHRLAGRVPALCAALSLGCGTLFATLSTEAEVYTFAAVFLAVSLDAFTRAHVERDARALAVGLASLTLGLTSHLALAFAGPAVVATWVMLGRRGVRIDTRGSLALATSVGAVLALYAGLLTRHRTGAPYSEFGEPATLHGLVRFITAARFQGDVRVPDLAGALHERPVAVVTHLARQWFLPVLLLLPAGFATLSRRAPPLAAFAALALLGWLGFAFVYEIPDADGFYVPVAVTGSMLIGLGVEHGRRPLRVAAVVACAAASLLLFAEQRRTDVPYDVLEDLGRGGVREGLDLPDLVRRIPAGAALTVPCGHYGCLGVANYYRFADPTTRSRGITIVTLVGGMPYGIPSPPPALPPVTARSRVICTVSSFEARLMSTSGAAVRTLPRPDGYVRGRSYTRVPVYCSTPAP